jgi:membrane protein implicated in regulation of membrane protease activity
MTEQRRPKRYLRWGLPEAPTPKHPYRDTLLVYAGFAIVIVLLGWLTGGSIGKAIVVAASVYVAASAWSIARWHQRLRREAAQREQLEDEP